jgi:2',3'-cyclic-nucleotide 2'-phosphodiesterase (5'-nucleotidase family)
MRRGWLLRFAPSLALLLLLAGGCAGRPAAAPPATAGGVAPQVVVHYFNDWHGHLEAFTRPGETSPIGGAGRVAALLAQRRAAAQAAGADTLLFVAGDVLQGTPMSTAFRGEPDFALLRRFAVDAMSLGNHEFDFGLDNLAARVEQAGFPVLAANVRRADGSLLVGDSVLLTTPRHGLRVAVLGLVTADAAVTTHPRNVTGLIFEHPVVTARREVPALAARSDLVVVVSHCGREVDRELAAVPGIDLVVGGHDQVLLQPPSAVGEAHVVQAMEWGEYLGEARLVLLGGTPHWLGNEYLRTVTEIAPDPEVEAFVGTYRIRLSAELARVVVDTAVQLEGRPSVIRREETNLGNLVADALREATGAELALINSGTIRSSIDAGEVTLEELMTALPFDNSLVVVALSGDEVRAMLERSLRVVGEGAFLQVSGLRLRAEGTQLQAVEVGGEPLDGHRLYQVATSDFLVAGGDGYQQAVGKPARETGNSLLDAVLRWMEVQPAPLLVEEDGRLQVGVPLALQRPAA